MAEAKKEFDPKKDPSLNDDSQPSAVTEADVLRQANERAGVPPSAADIPAPADAIDLAYRTAIADVDAQEVGKAVAAKQEAGVDAEDIDVKAMGEGRKSTKTTAKK